MDRRTSLKWMLAVAAAAPLGSRIAWGASTKTIAGYGTDPNLLQVHRAGDLWPLTFSDAQRRTAAALCAVIIPADDASPSAADLDVHLFIDEWISAPYPKHKKDRALILKGLAWIDRESTKRFRKKFAVATQAQQHAICDDICYVRKAAPRYVAAAKFFARFRDLTADGFYTTPEGIKDLGYVGNKPSVNFDGPPVAALTKVGVA